MTLARLFHGFNCRSDRSLAALGIKGNLWSIAAFVAGVLLLSAVLFLPFLHGIFAVTAVTAEQALQILLLAVAPTALVQLIRMVRELKK